MTFSSFMVNFETEGVYVFADSSNLNIQSTIVKVSVKDCASNGGIFPITDENLKMFSIVPRELELQRLPDNLISIPIIFIALTFVSTIS